MDEPIPLTPTEEFMDGLIQFGPLSLLGWLSFLTVIIIGCILLMVPRRNDRRRSLVDTFAACLHVQILIFILCVPLPLVGAAYLTDSNRPHLIDAFVAPVTVIFHFTISGALLAAVSLRHKTRPTIEWLPAISILTAVISLFAVWQVRLAASMPIH